MKRQEGREIVTKENLVALIKYITDELNDNQLDCLGDKVDMFPEQVRLVLSSADKLIGG